MAQKSCWLAVASLCMGAVALAQEAGTAGIGYAWQRGSGNQGSFASQYDLTQGLFLEGLRLDLRSSAKGLDRFDVAASGFGGDPFQRASLALVGRDRAWSLRLDYSRHEAVLPAPALDLALPGGTPQFASALADGGTFRITRWTGSFTWDGWRAARLRFDLRDVRRSGEQLSAFYGLGAPYVARTSLDERTQEAGLSLETRTLPVKLVLEQDVARYVREPRAGVGNGGQPLGGADPDLLATLSTPGRDSSTVPTTRLSAVYASGRFELVGQGLYRRDRLASDRNDETAFAIGGGATGRIGFLDAVMGAADTDTKLGDVRMGFAVAPALTLRVRGHWEDVATDASLVGLHVLELAGPGGIMDVPTPVDDRGYLDRTDRDVAGEADLTLGSFGLVVAYHDGSREIGALHGASFPQERVTRDASGWSATASLALGRKLTAQAGWDESSFAKYVFRTDPEKVTRVWGKLTARPAQGLELDAHASHERPENPPSVAALAAPTDAFGVAATYGSASGAFVSASLDTLRLTSELALVYWAPSLQTAVSRYDTDLLTASLRAALPLGGAVRVTGGGLWVKDRGDTLPFTSKSYDLEVEVPGPAGTRLAVFGNHWAYDLGGSSDQDYDTTRYGIAVRRRF